MYKCAGDMSITQLNLNKRYATLIDKENNFENASTHRSFLMTLHCVFFTLDCYRKVHLICICKKPTLDKEELSNYRPISNLSVISKIIERVVKSRLTEHLSTNNLLNPHESAYCKHNSTETALLYIHDYLINAIGSQKISCLCLLDLYAAFDTIDHNILLSRLSSWFGITGTVLDWFKSYLSSRPFRVKCESSFSSLHTCFVAFHKALFLAPFFLSSTPPLSVHSSHLFL